MIDLETVKAWAPIVVAVIVSVIAVCGWFITNNLNNRNEVFKQRLAERLKRRIEMYNAVMDVILPVIKSMYDNSHWDAKGLDPLASNANVLVSLYGDEHERRIFNAFIKKLSTGDEHGLIHITAEDVNPVSDLFRDSLRKELGYDPQ
jgi:hypothetical protein